jgi:drug/metabolite transporter (DMT)-like permease
VELQESLQEGAKAGGMVAAGGAVAYAGLLFILAAIAILLGNWWNNYWLGAAVVGIIAGIVGYVMLQGGIKQLKQISIVPHKTISSLQSDAELAKEKLS